MLTVFDVAEQLNVSVSTVRRLIREGRLESVKLGYRTVRVPNNSVSSLLEDASTPAVRDEFAPIRRRR